ncbi:NADAR family protein [Streptomyces albidus (ex Kaewkla and Franco 2022)]|uniref:NADAR family protein n=1 Tax=Streptomyces albidus (ex Kaewkla and Franco 2022) TaxID=722709 RepID=UPI0015EE585B|nr:NADAR family protein [Streptomyces albidus (ex Kaewkla and Franco 2022)]
MVENVAELIERAGRGERFKYLYFWGHQPRRDGAMGKGCLSQWWQAPFELEGVRYATTEHWMMARKARLFGDEEAEHRAIAAAHPRQAKAAGRSVRGFDQEVWERERYGIVVEGNVRKFGHHGELREYLLGTNSRVLVEASPMDRVWGVGLAADDERVRDPAKWRGQNLLGFALMEARTRLLTRTGTLT